MPSDQPRLIHLALSARTLIDRVLPKEEQLLGSIVTTGSRMFLVGPTGAGKTMLGLAMAGAIASGSGFLNWQASRQARVLYIDGEMSLHSLQRRVRDLERRMDDPNAIDEMLHILCWQDAGSLGLGDWQPLNTEDGQRFLRRLCNTLRPDVVFLDNLQSLVAGNMSEEDPWAATWPLVSELTARGIAQVWLDHTGHDKARQYGTSTKGWRFDTIGIMAPLPREELAAAELGFTLSFDAPNGKARNRSPENWTDYATQTIRLSDDVWTTSAPASAPKRTKLTSNERLALDALLRAIDDAGQEVNIGTNGELGLAVSEAAWWECYSRECKAGDKQDTKRTAFKRSRDSLQALKRIASMDDFVWPRTT